MLDIIFCSLPYSNLDHICSASAILQGVVKERGYSSKTIDFGCELMKLCDNDPDIFYRVQTYFITTQHGLSENEIVIITSFYQIVVNYIKNNPSKFIGFSIFSVYTHRAIFEILSLIQRENINTKIVIGGRGAKVPLWRDVVDIFSVMSDETALSTAEILKKRNLIDYYIIGDGEDAIISLLENSEIFSDTMVDSKSETFRTPMPDYSDYNFSDYLFGDGEVSLPITGSKGCVRDCDFCDVRHHFGRYRYRSGEDIANEMIGIANTHNIRKFQFTDSLVNGGLKPFEEFLEIVGNYNLTNPDQKIKWNGQYICRPENQMPKRLYRLMAESGAEGLTIGAESGSNRVLAAMNKKTTVEALYHELEQFREHHITCYLLTFVGHWSETWEDFVEHCGMFIKITPYVKSGTISAVSLGRPMDIQSGTPLIENITKNNMELSNFNPSSIWKVTDNASNTYKERVYRRLIVDKLLKALKIPTVQNLEFFSMMQSLIDTHSDQINKFYENGN